MGRRVDSPLYPLAIQHSCGKPSCLIDKSSGNEPFSIAMEAINQPITGGHQSCWNNIFHGQGTRVNIGNGHLIIELEIPIVAITFPY